MRCAEGLFGIGLFGLGGLDSSGELLGPLQQRGPILRGGRADLLAGPLLFGA